jgi:hypothetical protein
VVGPKKWLKGEGYFLQKMNGKKPQPGLYTDDELTILIAEWEKKATHISNIYKNRIPDKWDEVVTNGDKTSAVMAMFQVKTLPLVKAIEDTARGRIPYLLVVSGRGKDKIQTIIKGSSLTDKIIAMELEDPRTMAKVMWTPIQGFNITAFCDLCMRVARAKVVRGERALEDTLSKTWEHDPDSKARWAKSSALIYAVADLIISQGGEGRSTLPAWASLMSKQ